MEFDINQVYPPSEDTFLLIKAALAEVKPKDSVIEIGCGSGAVIESLKCRARYVLGVDINPHAVYFTNKKGVNAVRSDLFGSISGLFDLILFNAPYLPTEKDEKLNDWLEYALDGGENGREVIEKFLPQAVSHLTRYGRILLLISSLTGLSEINSLCKSMGLISLVVEQEKMEDGELLYVLRITRDLCSI
ncbi:MAG: 50S ribosomal protein L11 methyltransferase [Methanocorpusculum sp.]|nr:50S ribosomal protein L11 methyltransferase [Methanocorpusculum sp.]